jgi:hypothetical protein
MVNEKVSEAVVAQPSRKHVGMVIVLTRMTYEENRHRPNFLKIRCVE